MPVLNAKRLSDSVVTFDMASCEAAGANLFERYRAAEPFPHIVLDDFIDREILKGLLEEWPDASEKRFYNRAQERLKYEWQPHELTSPRLRSFLAEMNSEPVLRFLEKMTGIPKLIADPYYLGGGLHQIGPGGHLSVHADFNIHTGMNVIRRLNLLIYLNEDWQDEYGGHLELWEKDMSASRVKVAPIIGRAVVFNTDSDSFHGHPEPLTCPPERSRRSLALYYYTAAEDGLAALPERTTLFRPRPGTQDKSDFKVALRHLVKDWVPPALMRSYKSYFKKSQSNV
jgi:Rps23 Pro-64 3,4-dihydroxylase Tpa1-like proline 4-hydroxylase